MNEEEPTAKVYDIYSGQPKRFGLTPMQFGLGLASVSPCLWLQKFWLLLVLPPIVVLVVGILSKGEDNVFVKWTNFLLPNFLRGKYQKHTFAERLGRKTAGNQEDG